MTGRFLILDCYVDEPACFGVPPFISPYPRYIYGALMDAGIPPGRIDYATIDRLRAEGFRIAAAYEHVFLVGGAVVPGRYLGSHIGTMAELKKIIETNSRLNFAVGGLISSVFQHPGNNSLAITGDIEKFAYTLASGNAVDTRRTTDEIARWAVLGAPVVALHPHFPHIICEMETYRGCPRLNHCSFCSEGLFKTVEFRRAGDILAEIDSLIATGVSRFRLGRQADILQYGTSFSEFSMGFPRPDPSPVIDLFRQLKDRRDRGLISVLNIDNANPGTIARFPRESTQILEAIADAVTPGDTMALGIESFDPDVIAHNGLKVTGEEAVEVIRLINKIGGIRRGGIPVILPGINLIQGLRGETAETFSINHRWLLRIRDEGLLIKRINIRKLLPFPGTVLYNERERTSQKLLNRFEFYRAKIRHDIDIPMLKAIYPPGTLVTDNLLLEHHDGYSLAKQIASYSITVKYPVELPLDTFQDAVVTGHRERSLIALPSPIAVNSLHQKALELIPGISKKGASDIIIHRPFADLAQFHAFLKERDIHIPDTILRHCTA